MYRTGDRQAAIREIKKYLYVISTKVYPEIERTTIDGQYDEPTREAVKAFQRIRGLADNGEVDIDTFYELYEAYRAARDDFYRRDYVIESTNFPINIGYTGENARAINMLVNELAKHHESVEDAGTGSYYSTRTARSVRALRRAYGLPESDTVDKEMFSLMLTELEAIRRRDKNPPQADLFGDRRL